MLKASKLAFRISMSMTENKRKIFRFSPLFPHVFFLNFFPIKNSCFYSFFTPLKYLFTLRAKRENRDFSRFFTIFLKIVIFRPQKVPRLFRGEELFWPPPRPPKMAQNGRFWPDFGHFWPIFDPFFPNFDGGTPVIFQKFHRFFFPL